MNSEIRRLLNFYHFTVNYIEPNEFVSQSSVFGVYKAGTL